MSVRRFASGDHDEYLCKHILDGLAVGVSIDHTDYPDGSVDVDFDGVDDATIESRIATYNRGDYEQTEESQPQPEPVAPLTPAEVAELRALIRPGR